MIKPKPVQVFPAFEGDMTDEYTRGQMDISEHKKTFDSVMSVSVFSSLLIGLCLFYLTLVFGTGGGWFGTLVLTGVLGAVGGFFTRQGIMYWTCLAGLGLIALTGGLLTSLMA
jgi:hypothetical protein